LGANYLGEGEVEMKGTQNQEYESEEEAESETTHDMYLEEVEVDIISLTPEYREKKSIICEFTNYANQSSVELLVEKTIVSPSKSVGVWLFWLQV
jgi:hypothetical protein